MVERYRQGVMAVLVDDDNKVLIGSSPRDGGYKFPQGGLNEGESPREAIRREVREELGLELRDDDILEEHEERVRYYQKNRPLYPGDDIVGQEQVVFKVRYRDDMALSPQDHEFDELVWINPKELEKYETYRRIKAYRRALELCGLR